jgi:serine/threonine-protein kinase
VEPVDAVTTRCREIGLDDVSFPDAGATIRLTAGRIPTTAPTLASAKLRITTSRELPRISVELRGTLSGAGTEEPIPVSDGRDLEVIRTLGEGGMGRVFLARQHSLDRDVAVKTVRDGASERERVALLAEGAITGHLEHPAVIPVHALGMDPAGRPVLVMKRVEGAAWNELLANPQHEAWRDDGGDAGDRLVRHLEILMQVCNATSFAHSRGIIHRDIKPENVLIGSYGEVYLADWGIALRTEDATPAMPMCGTPSYMAPEMVVGGVIDARTDVYLLGATLHHILTGRPRHAATNFRAVLFAASSSDPFEYPATVPALLAALANAATSLDPAKRPSSAAEVRQAIAAYLRHRSSIALADSAVRRLQELEVLVEDGTALTSEGRQREIDVLAAEVRFALDQALRDWAGNEAARNASSTLEKLVGSRRARAAELERLARDLDPNTARRPRELAYAALAAVGLGLSASAFLGRRDVSTRGIFYESLAPVAIVAIATLVLRRQLLRTTLNRRTVFGLQATLLGVAIHRALGLLAGMSATHVLVGDLVLLGTMAMLGAAFVFRWVAWCGVVLLVGAAWAAAVPEEAMRAFAAASGVAFLVMGYFAWRTAPRRRTRVR